MQAALIVQWKAFAMRRPGVLEVLVTRRPKYRPSGSAPTTVVGYTYTLDTGSRTFDGVEAHPWRSFKLTITQPLAWTRFGAPEKRLALLLMHEECLGALPTKGEDSAIRQALADHWHQVYSEERPRG